MLLLVRTVYIFVMPVRWSASLSSHIHIGSGVRQGIIKSPDLFRNVFVVNLRRSG